MKYLVPLEGEVIGFFHLSREAGSDATSQKLLL
jgi:hypothetical protein